MSSAYVSVRELSKLYVVCSLELVVKGNNFDQQVESNIFAMYTRGLKLREQHGSPMHRTSDCIILLFSQ